MLTEIRHGGEYKHLDVLHELLNRSISCQNSLKLGIVIMAGRNLRVKGADLTRCTSMGTPRPRSPSQLVAAPSVVHIALRILCCLDILQRPMIQYVVVQGKKVKVV